MKDFSFWREFWNECCKRPFTIFCAVMGGVFVIKSIIGLFK